MGVAVLGAVAIAPLSVAGVLTAGSISFDVAGASIVGIGCAGVAGVVPETTGILAAVGASAGDEGAFCTIGAVEVPPLGDAPEAVA